jgi:hypothetical protein
MDQHSLGDHCSSHSQRDGHQHIDHVHSLYDELVCHFPYAAFSLSLGFVILAILDLLVIGSAASPAIMQSAYHTIFHGFHYLHLIFAVTGTYVTYLRYAPRDYVRGAVIALITPAIFCTLSDVALPAVVAQILGFEVDVHICFTSLPDTLNLLPFMLVGLLNGYCLTRHTESSLGFVSLVSHFIHILISCLAALFYLVAHGCVDWACVMGLLFGSLVVAVVIPCTLADIVVPMFFARYRS